MEIEAYKRILEILIESGCNINYPTITLDDHIIDDYTYRAVVEKEVDGQIKEQFMFKFSVPYSDKKRLDELVTHIANYKNPSLKEVYKELGLKG